MVGRWHLHRLRAMHPLDAAPTSQVVFPRERYRLLKRGDDVDNRSLRPVGRFVWHTDLCSIDHRKANSRSMRMGLDSPTEAIMVGDCKCFVAKMRSLLDELPRPRGTIEKGVIRVTMKLSVSTHRVTLIEHVFDCSFQIRCGLRICV